MMTSAADTVRIAAFDLDGTLVDGNSQAMFVRFLARHGIAPASLRAEVAFWFALSRTGWRLDVPRVHTRLIARLSQIPRDTLQNAIAEFTKRCLVPQLKADAREWMARLRAEGCHVMLLSAALEPMVALTAASMRADGFTATRVRRDRSGRLAVDGNMIYGEAKLRALRDYADERFPSWRLEYAFGNDYADRFLLRAAATAIAVCPSRELRALAEREGWRHATWR